MSADPERLDALTHKLTAFPTFEALLGAEGGYFPSLWCTKSRARAACELRELADAYDRAQTERGDPRRAFRGY